MARVYNRNLLLFWGLILAIPIAPVFVKYIVVDNFELRILSAFFAGFLLIMTTLIKKKFNIGLSDILLIFVGWQIVVEISINQLSGSFVLSILSQLTGIIVGLLLIQTKNEVGQFVVIFSILLIFVSQVAEMYDLLPHSLNGNPSPNTGDGRYNGLGYVNDNGFLYGLVALWMFLKLKVIKAALWACVLFLNQTGSPLLAILYSLPSSFTKSKIGIGLISFFSVLVSVSLLTILNDLQITARFASLAYRVLLWEQALKNFQFDFVNVLCGIGMSDARQLTLPLQAGTVHSNWLSIFFSFGIVGVYLQLLMIKRFFFSSRACIIIIYVMFHGVTHEFYLSAPIIATLMVINNSLRRESKSPAQ